MERFRLADTYDQFRCLMRKHTAEVRATSGWSIPPVCQKVFELARTGGTFAAIEAERVAREQPNDPVDDITEHWAKLVAIEVYQARCVDEMHLRTAVRSTWPAFDFWSIFSEEWVNNG